jgi:hypothetical protein
MGCSPMGPSMNELSDIETTPAGLPSDTQFAIPRGLCYQSMGHIHDGLPIFYSLTGAR